MLPEGNDPASEWDLCVRDVSPLPAFDAIIGSALRRWRDEELRWISLPYPAASEAEARMHDAWADVCTIWQELELQDEAGRVLPIPIVGFNGHVCSLANWEISAGVAARLRDEYMGGSTNEPPSD